MPPTVELRGGAEVRAKTVGVVVVVVNGYGGGRDGGGGGDG
jgi:hypothetical protein